MCFSNPLQLNIGAPTPRAACSMSAVDRHLVIFGGKDADGRKNDLHIFDTGKRTANPAAGKTTDLSLRMVSSEIWYQSFRFDRSYMISRSRIMNDFILSLCLINNNFLLLHANVTWLQNHASGC